MKLSMFLGDTLSSKGSVKVSLNEVDKYRERYDKVLERKLKFKSAIYKLTNGDAVVHVKVPSESVSDFYYDVVIQFSSNGANSFEECDVRMFSNSPSFVFTSAHVFYYTIDEALSNKRSQYRLLISGAEKKFPAEVIAKKPETRNPYGIPLLDKTLYYAVFHILDTMNFNRTMNNLKVYGLTQLFQSILSYDKLMANRDIQKAKNTRNKKTKATAQKKKLTKIEGSINKVNRTGNAVNKVRATKSVEKTKPIRQKR